MTLQVLLIAAVRTAGSLPVLRWPLAGGILALLVDLSDLLLRDAIDLGGVPDYQSLDKWLDQVYLVCFLVVAVRWTGTERTVAVALYAFRIVGFVVFEATGDRTVLLFFPNVFEVWFLAVAAAHHFFPDRRWSRIEGSVALAAVTIVKELQEWALHGARIFDGRSSTDFLRDVLRWLGGG
jgi:hypothetical protein